jgi:hypothetical protein
MEPKGTGTQLEEPAVVLIPIKEELDDFATTEAAMLEPEENQLQEDSEGQLDDVKAELLDECAIDAALLEPEISLEIKAELDGDGEEEEMDQDAAAAAALDNNSER